MKFYLTNDNACVCFPEKHISKCGLISGICTYSNVDCLDHQEAKVDACTASIKMILEILDETDTHNFDTVEVCHECVLTDVHSTEGMQGCVVHAPVIAKLASNCNLEDILKTTDYLNIPSVYNLAIHAFCKRIESERQA